MRKIAILLAVLICLMSFTPALADVKRPSASEFKGWQWPVKEKRVLCGFHCKSGVHSQVHSGVDIKGSLGIYPAANGKVVAKDYNSSNGYNIIIKHDNGFYTHYKHLKKGSIRVSVGDTVTKDERIATMGNTGRSFGTHLHFETGYSKSPYSSNLRGQFNPIIALP
ncbi:MAG: M23 family metallopeptidase [Anaerovoracaceae bacterium]